MQLFELVSPRLFRPLAGPNRAFYAELLLLLWEECRHTADYSISRAEAVSIARTITPARRAAAKRLNIFIVMFLLFSNSDGLGDPKSLYPSEFILSIPPPRMSTGISPKFRPSFWQLSPNTKKPRGAGCSSGQ